MNRERLNPNFKELKRSEKTANLVSSKLRELGEPISQTQERILGEFTSVLFWSADSVAFLYSRGATQNVLHTFVMERASGFDPADVSFESMERINDAVEKFYQKFRTDNLELEFKQKFIAPHNIKDARRATTQHFQNLNQNTEHFLGLFKTPLEI